MDIAVMLLGIGPIGEDAIVTRRKNELELRPVRNARHASEDELSRLVNNGGGPGGITTGFIEAKAGGRAADFASWVKADFAHFPSDKLQRPHFLQRNEVALLVEDVQWRHRLV